MNTFYDVCKKGDINEVNRYIEKNRQIYWNSGLYGACSGGHEEIALLMIEKGANNFNWGLHGACSGGHEEIALLMIEKGADYLNLGLYNACYYGYKELALLMISLGCSPEGSRSAPLRVNDFNDGLRGACSGGYKELALLMISLGANDFNDGLRGACSGGYKELILLMIEKGADIDKCRIILDLEDIYYLYQKELTLFGKYKNIYEQCKAIKALFLQISNEIFISDISNIIVSY